MQRGNAWFASDLVGHPVRNTAGETLGQVEEFVIDPATGAVHFAVLSISGRLQDRVIAVPYSALEFVPGRDYVLLDMDKNALLGAPSFTRGQSPNFSDPAWRAHVNAYYGYSDQPPVRERTTVVHRDRPVRARGISLGRAIALMVLLVSLMGLTYMVSTRGWPQTRADLKNLFSGVTYAMRDTSADAALTAKVKAALALNKSAPATTINVDSQDGIVTLRGEVNEQQTRELAGKIAQDTPGVREVRNYLYVTSTGK
jgi:sporulation protein YlmC with PRC-barrel domain